MPRLTNFLGPSALATFLCTGLLTMGVATPLQTRSTTAAITTLSAAQISSFKPYSFYAAMAYCQSSHIMNRSCGNICAANPSFKPVATGGDGAAVQLWYAGYDTALKTVVVGHQGTDPSKVLPLFTDADFVLGNLDSKLFPGISSSIKVHTGFAEAHAKTAHDVLAAVKTSLQKSGFSKVTLVGHSLGGALTLLDSVYLPLFVPHVTFKTITYGMPRVGNPAFASYIDSHVDLNHVNNKEDFVPTLPPRLLGFQHPQGEKHIQDNLSWVACPGDDNGDSRCSLGDVSNIFKWNEQDHFGPYDGVSMGDAC